MLMQPLPQEFFGLSAQIVAPRLLGHWLLRWTERGLCGGPIVETEAYLVGDPACHAFGGMTERNRVMWGEPGRAYVYLIYGYHYCVNAVCCPPGTAEAVLIRSLEPAQGLETMQRRRAVRKPRDLTNGPAKLCAALGIDRKLDGADLCDTSSPLFIGRNPEVGRFLEERGPIVVAPRVGITKAADLPLRFYLVKSESVSRRVRDGRE